MAEALAAFEAAARIDGHPPDSGERSRHHLAYFRDRFAHLLHGMGFEPARSFTPQAYPTPRGTALAAFNPS